MKLYKVGILGATGAVGREMMKILAERQFPISELRLFASSRSAGKVVEWNGRPVMIQEPSEENFRGLDIVLGAAESDIAGGRARGRGVCGQLVRLPHGR